MMEATSLFVAIGLLILLAATSMRFGVDSREGFASKERDQATRGLNRIGSPTARDRRLVDELHRARQMRRDEAFPKVARGI